MEVLTKQEFAFEFSDGSKAVFDIERPTKQQRQMLMDAARAKKKNFEKRDEDLFDRWDWDKHNLLVIRRVITGWHGLKNKHLIVILDPDKGDSWKFVPNEKGEMRRETEVPYSEEMKRVISENYSANFLTFINTCQDLLTEQNAKQKEAELKN